MKKQLECANCKKIFRRQQWQYNNQVNQGNSQFFCSRLCYQQYCKQSPSENLIHASKKYSQKIKNDIKEMRIFGSSYQTISKTFDIPIGSISYLLRKG